MRVWFGGITKNEQLFKSGLFRKITQKDVQELTFDRPFMTWIDYDTTLRRETIEETAEIIRKATKSGMLVLCTGSQMAAAYRGEHMTVNPEGVLEDLDGLLSADESWFFEDLTRENIVDRVRIVVDEYYHRLVMEKNERENKNYRLLTVGRLEYTKPTNFINDIWLLVDSDEVDVEKVEKEVLGSKDAGYHCLDMPVLTERERDIIGSRLDEDAEVLSEELSIDVNSIKKYQRYWDDYMG